MKFSAILGACVGAAIGAALWGAIAYHYHYELAVVAWVIGGIVGVMSVVTGGRGASMGIVCALLAAVAIFGGKMLAVHFLVSGYVEEIIQEEINPTLYEEMLQDAKDFALVESEEQYPQFIAEHGYSEFDEVQLVSEEDIEDFKSDTVDLLRSMNNNPPSYENWKRDQEYRVRRDFSKSFSTTSAASDDLNFYDVLFFFLGVSTAFKVGAGLTDD